MWLITILSIPSHLQFGNRISAKKEIQYGACVVHEGSVLANISFFQRGGNDSLNIWVSKVLAKEFTNLNVTYHNYFSHAFPPSNPTLSGCPLHSALDIGVFGSNSNNTSNFLLISCSFPLLYTIITPYVRKILTFRVFGQMSLSTKYILH